MQLITTKICMASDIGIHGNLFGGFLLAWIDEAAAAYVSLKCETSQIVTLKISELIFKTPVKKGDLIKIFGNITKIGRTSVTLGIEVKKIVPETSIETSVTTATLIFVKIDDNGIPCEISENIRQKYTPDNFNKFEKL